MQRVSVLLIAGLSALDSMGLGLYMTRTGNVLVHPVPFCLDKGKQVIVISSNF